MEAIVTALGAQLAELEELVADLDDVGWAAPSACDGWSVADVLLHLAQTNEVAIASASGRWDEVASWWGGGAVDGSVDDLAAEVIETNRGASGPEVHARWKRSADEMVDAFAAIDPRARVPWVVGDMAARTLATTRLAETWIHTTDIAVGLSVDLPPTDRLWHISRLVHRTVPYAFTRAGEPDPGPVRFELSAPEDSTEVWTFGDAGAPTLVTGSAADLCRVAGQRADAADTGLVGHGPAAPGVMRLMRTFA